jgi:CheY-like chemotaxis protein
MTLSLKNVFHGLLFNGSIFHGPIFHGPGKNGNSGGFAHEKKPALLSTESCCTAKTVLFVDDEPSILTMRRLVFEALGYSVLTAICGEDALEMFATYPVDAVVLDYLMPGIDGEETARRLRKLRSDIPIILSSGCLTVPERVFEVVDMAVEKGARPEALIDAVAQQLHPLVCSPPNKDTELCAASKRSLPKAVQAALE